MALERWDYLPEWYFNSLHENARLGRRLDEVEDQNEALVEAVKDLLVTDRPSAWRMWLGEKRHEEIVKLARAESAGGEK